MSATRRKNEAARRYQEKLRSIAQAAPAEPKAVRQKSARDKYQSQVKAADESLLAARKNN
jgi:hypothetical protein